MASVRARVRCEIEVDVGLWDGKSTFDDLREQVRREGAELIRRVLSPAENKLPLDVHGRLIGTPTVLFVVVDEQGQKGNS